MGRIQRHIGTMKGQVILDDHNHINDFGFLRIVVLMLFMADNLLGKDTRSVPKGVDHFVRR
eukprot:scaffold19632_cov133-Amphora_coffeaeformis.AAC.1